MHTVVFQFLFCAASENTRPDIFTFQEIIVDFLIFDCVSATGYGVATQSDCFVCSRFRPRPSVRSTTTSPSSAPSTSSSRCRWNSCLPAGGRRRGRSPGEGNGSLFLPLSSSSPTPTLRWPDPQWSVQTHVSDFMPKQIGCVVIKRPASQPPSKFSE